MVPPFGADRFDGWHRGFHLRPYLFDRSEVGQNSLLQFITVYLTVLKDAGSEKRDGVEDRILGRRGSADPTMEAADDRRQGLAGVG
jgi:hypothetical protein